MEQTKPRSLIAFTSSQRHRLAGAVLSCLLGLVTQASATIVSVVDATSSFTVLNPGYTLADVADDQQTGDKAADFVSSTGTPGFYMKFGQINGVDSLVFRFTFQVYNSHGFSGSVRLGMDADSDGDIDLFFGPGVTNQAKNSGIFFQDPGTGLNVSPSTTSLGNNYGRVGLSSDNYNYSSTGITGQDGQLTFAIAFQSIADALGIVSEGAITLTPDDFVRFLAFTAQQVAANSINQDILGINGGTNSSVRFDEPGGGFTDYVDGSGSPVPELSSFTYALGMILTGISIQLNRTRRRARSTS